MDKEKSQKENTYWIIVLEKCCYTPSLILGQTKVTRKYTITTPTPGLEFGEWVIVAKLLWPLKLLVVAEGKFSHPT